MSRPVPAMTAAALALGAVLITACSDHPFAPTTPFEVTVRVVDLAGDPVPGLDLMLVMDSPYYQDGLAAKKASVNVRFAVPYESHVTVAIEDAARREVRKLVDSILVAGVHEATWNGRDGDGAACYSGLYYARLIGRNPAGAVVHDERRPMVLALLDFSQATIGTTDGDGRIVLRDRRLFPALYGNVAMQAFDEDANPRGDFLLTHMTRFYLRDPAGGGAMRFDREVTDTGQTIVLTWPTVAAAAVAPGSPATVRPFALADEAGSKIDFSLSPPYPNPFN